MGNRRDNERSMKTGTARERDKQAQKEEQQRRSGTFVSVVPYCGCVGARMYVEPSATCSGARFEAGGRNEVYVRTKGHKRCVAGPCLIKGGQHPGGDDRPEADLRKQRERSEQEETVDQQLDGVRVRQLRRPT